MPDRASAVSLVHAITSDAAFVVPEAPPGAARADLEGDTTARSERISNGP